MSLDSQDQEPESNQMSLDNEQADDDDHPHDQQQLPSEVHPVQEDQDLGDGINEQMSLFWGAVSSVFAENGSHGQGEGQGPLSSLSTLPVDSARPTARMMEDEEEGDSGGQQDGCQSHNDNGTHHDGDDNDNDDTQPGSGHEHTTYAAFIEQEAARVTDEQAAAAASSHHQDGDDDGEQGDSGPRNEWEHVQLLMSLGGALGHDLAELESLRQQDHRGESLHHERGGQDQPPSHGSLVQPVVQGQQTIPLTAEAGPGPTTIARKQANSRKRVNGKSLAHKSPPPRAHALHGTTPSTGETVHASPSPVPSQTATPSAAAPTPSSSTTTTTTTTTRPLLSAAERRANHVSSEQRRRNAIRIGYAELGALEHTSVNTEWPCIGDMEQVVKESQGMVGMEELLGRPAPLVAVDTGEDPSTGEKRTRETQDDDNGGTTASTTKKPKKSKRGIHINGHGPTSKSDILQKGAHLAQWLTRGNDWLRGEVWRLEVLLGVGDATGGGGGDSEQTAPWSSPNPEQGSSAVQETIPPPPHVADACTATGGSSSSNSTTTPTVATPPPAEQEGLFSAVESLREPLTAIHPHQQGGHAEGGAEQLRVGTWE